VKRLWFLVKARVSRLLDRAERPDVTLDYSYERQLELLQTVKRGTAEVTAAKKRLEITADKRTEQVLKLEGQARQALAAGREDLARLALARKVEVQHELHDLDAQVDTLEKQQSDLVDRERRLRDQIARFRSEKEVLKAQYSAAEAMVKIGEATSGLGEGLAETGRAIERARDKTESMTARAAALDELLASDALEDVLAGGETHLDRELKALSAGQQVDEELAALKRELPAPEAAN
jgi:phage shock protein A